MRRLQTTLYSFAAPWLLLPVMDFSFGQIAPYLKGLEFRAFISEIITQLIAGVFDAGIIGFFRLLFGVQA